MARPVVALEFAFFEHLWQFHQAHRGRIRRHYHELSRRFLDYNDPGNARAYLRQPQFEALEMYVFLKEFCDNQPLHAIFQEWSDEAGRFQGRQRLALFESVNQAAYDAVFGRMRAQARTYPSYIFALTMGTGKTILMATCIYYEFILANKFPKDARFCHNALVFAPDKTVLQSLREIQTFDLQRVVPPEYAGFLTTNLRFHFLDDAGTALSVLDRSRFNVIISNTQKIILKKSHTGQSAAARLFGSGPPTYEPKTVYGQAADLYGFDEPADEAELTTNQRFEKLRRLEQLGVYVDEAHHAFGAKLARDMGVKRAETSLRTTIDELAASLARAGTQVVACFNYTGTPYVGNEVLPEVVYAYGLRDAIDNAYLKQVRIHSYTNTRSTEFVRLVVDEFLEHHGGPERYEGMLPKLAFFAATIEELQSELRPAVEDALARHGMSPDRILVNVGDPKLTSNDDIRAFNRLDTPESEKQFVLLVNKGREGWNCRSLFGVALFRRPKSKIFVLQATMRCLRAIGDYQPTGRVYLSEENRAVLEDELQQNFRVTLDDVQSAAAGKAVRHVRVNQPPVTVNLVRIETLYRLREKPIVVGHRLGLDGIDTAPYEITHKEFDHLVPMQQRRIAEERVTYIRDQRRYSSLTLVAEIARYLNKPCVFVEEVLSNTAEGVDGILVVVNRYNEVLYDHVIPRLFGALYEVTKYESKEVREIALVKEPPGGYYAVTARPDLTVTPDAFDALLAERSFHLDAYCFDSKPERELFLALMRDHRARRIYFTGMLTHGQSDFFIQYIDPESHAVRSYYPDFLLRTDADEYVIVEVKGDHQIDDPIVRAKQAYASQMAGASGMRYEMLKGSDAELGRYSVLFGGGSEQLGLSVD